MSDAIATQLRVLVADDDQDHCLIMQRMLESDGFSVAFANTGQAVLQVIDEFKPKVIILDSMLPDKPGLECLREIRENPDCSGVYVIMCSGRTDIDYVLECTEAGAKGFFHKPIDLESVSHRVRKVMRIR